MAAPANNGWKGAPGDPIYRALQSTAMQYDMLVTALYLVIVLSLAIGCSSIMGKQFGINSGYALVSLLVWIPLVGIVNTNRKSTHDAVERRATQRLKIGRTLPYVLSKRFTQLPYNDDHSD